FATFVAVLEQALSRQLVHRAHQPQQAWILDAGLVRAPALAVELQSQFLAQEARVPGTQRGQAERPVLARVAVVADADQGIGHDRDHAGEHLLARQPRQREIGADPAPQLRQRFPERDDAVELVGIAQRAPVGVVTVLFAPTRIAAGGLQVAAWRATDPDLSVRWRNGQGA